MASGFRRGLRRGGNPKAVAAPGTTWQRDRANPKREDAWICLESVRVSERSRGGGVYACLLVDDSGNPSLDLRFWGGATELAPEGSPSIRGLRLSREQWSRCVEAGAWLWDYLDSLADEERAGLVDSTSDDREPNA